MNRKFTSSSSLLPPPPPGIRNPSGLSNNLSRHIPYESLPLSSSRSNIDDELIQMSNALPRPAIESSLRSQLAELENLMIPLRKESVHFQQSSTLSSPTPPIITQPIRFRIDLHRDIKEAKISDKIDSSPSNVMSHISPKQYTPGSIFSRIERVDSNHNPVVIESDVSNIETSLPPPFKGLPVPLLIINDSNSHVSGYSSDLEPRVYEIQRLVTCMCRGSHFITQAGYASTSVGVAMPRTRVILHLEKDLRTFCLEGMSSDNLSLPKYFNILEIESIEFHQTRTFSLNLCSCETGEMNTLHLFAPDVALAFDWVNGITILQGLARPY